MEIPRKAKLAIELIDKHMDFDDVIKDVTTDGDFDNVLNIKCKVKAISKQKLAQQILIKEVIKITESNQQFLNPAEIKHFKSLTFKINAIIQETVQMKVWLQYKSMMKHCIPLNALSYMESINVITLHEYLMINIDHENVLKEFISNLNSSFYCENQDLYQECGIQLVSKLILYGYSSEDYSKGMRKICGYVIFNVFKNTLQHLTEIELSKVPQRSGNFIGKLFTANSTNNADNPTLKCYLQIIALWITNNPNISAVEAISSQSKWVANQQHKSLVDIYKTMISCIGPKVVFNSIRNIISRKEVNWKHLLTMSSSMLVLFPEAKFMFRELIKSNLSDGIDNQETEKLFIAFLFMRQFSLEGGHAFSGYSEFFVQHFGNGPENCVNKTRNFRFFIKFLTTLLPYDSVKFLKVHVFKPPYGPSTCKKVLNDYLALARVRLHELGGNLQTNESKHSALQQLQTEITQSVKEFESTGKVSRSILEMNIFRKAYFTGKYLPELLKPRIFPTIPDSRMKFINQLFAMQKIPRAMYDKYMLECKTKVENMVNEIIDLDMDSDFESDPIEELERELYQLKNFSNPNSFGEIALCEPLTKLSRICNMIDHDDNGTCDNVVILETDKPMSTKMTQISDILYNFYGGWDLNEESVLTFLNRISDILAKHYGIINALVHRVWNYFMKPTKNFIGLPITAPVYILSSFDAKVKVSLPVNDKLQLIQQHFNIGEILQNNDGLYCAPFLEMILMHACFCNKDIPISFIENFIGSVTTLKENSFLVCLKLFYNKRMNAKLGKYRNQFNVQMFKSETLDLKSFLVLEISLNLNADILSTFEKEIFYNSVFNENIKTVENIKDVIKFLLECIDFKKILNTCPDPQYQVVYDLCKSLHLLHEARVYPSGPSNILLEIIEDRPTISDECDPQIFEIQHKRFIVNMKSLILLSSSEIIFQLPFMKTDESFISRDESDSKGTLTKCLANGAKIINHIVQNSDNSFLIDHHFVLYITKMLIDLSQSYSDSAIIFSISMCPVVFISMVYYCNKGSSLNMFIGSRLPLIQNLINHVLSESRSELKKKLLLAVDAAQHKSAYDVQNLNVEQSIEAIITCTGSLLTNYCGKISRHEFHQSNDVLDIICMSITLWEKSLFQDDLFLDEATKCFEQVNLDSFYDACIQPLPSFLANLCNKTTSETWPFCMLWMLCQVEVPKNMLKSTKFQELLIGMKDKTDKHFGYKITSGIVEIADKFNNLLILCKENSY